MKISEIETFLNNDFELLGNIGSSRCIEVRRYFNDRRFILMVYLDLLECEILVCPMLQNKHNDVDTVLYQASAHKGIWYKTENIDFIKELISNAVKGLGQIF